MERIGVRELRQHASRYLARVAAGESLEVTDRGVPVAHLVPVTDDPWQDLVRRGLVTLPEPGADLLELVAAAPASDGVSLSAALEQLRAAER